MSSQRSLSAFNLVKYEAGFDIRDYHEAWKCVNASDHSFDPMPM
jgi:hypothetical protein